MDSTRADVFHHRYDILQPEPRELDDKKRYVVDRDYIRQILLDSAFKVE